MTRGFAFAALVSALGCTRCGAAAEPAMRVEPTALHFTPARPALALRLANDGPTPLPLGRIRVDHRDPDWVAFTLTDTTLPKQIEPGSAAELHMRVDLDHFKGTEPGGPHRSGEATLTLTAGDEARRIPLRFGDEGTSLAALLIRLGLLAALAGALALLARRFPRPGWTIALPTLVAVAIAPLGSGFCPGLAGATLGPADLLQCADGRGGEPLQLWPHPDGLGLVLVALLFAALGRISGDTGALRRSLGLALALLALMLGGNLDPQTVVQAQADLRWGVWMQPFAAAALVIAAAAEVQATRAVDAVAGRIAAVGLAALLTTLCLAGADLPVRPGLPHAAVVALGIVLWLAKVTGVAWLLGRAAVPTWLRRAVVPLAIVQILLVVLGLSADRSVP